jgi:tRNA A-37 threonylcarbamoyl transferase component Bud32/tetratricopeptide (TPR) repeat protein
MNLSGVVVGNRYTIEREIGRGGMATVWLAHDAQHARRIAIKALHPELAGAIGTDRFLREVRLTAELQHPSVVPILDSGAVDWDGMRLPWYAMPFLDGESLRSRLNRETQLPIDEALRITTGVGKALVAAHQRGIVHRDIKPENVFLSGDHVYVVDFGVAKAIADTEVERLTSTGLAIGTPTYMSPEQALAGTVDARSDQYSLAVMLYEMLAGEPPFAGPNQQATLARRLAERARPISTVRSTVPAAVEHATLRALERTPADRFPSVDGFLAALSAPSGSSRVSRLSRHSLLAVAVAVILVTAVGTWTMMRGPSVDPEVLALYERGVRAYDRRTREGAVEAAAALGDAIHRDSSFAPAWNALAQTYVRAYQRGFALPEVPRERLLPLAANAVDRSLALDETNADAWTTHGIVSAEADPTNLTTPLKSLRRSLALDSLQPVAWHVFARMMADSGDLTTALAAWRNSVRIAPKYTQALAFLGLGHYWRGQYDLAAFWADSAVRVDPLYLLGRQVMTVVEIERGRFAAAEDQARAALRLAEDVEAVNSQANLALVKARAGKLNLARADLLVAEVAAGGFLPTPAHTALYLAEVHAAVGDVDGAFKAVGTYGTQRDAHFQFHLRCSPTFAPLENEPRFRALLVIPRPPPGAHC